jgi:DNA mismatch repair ATPase MutL
LNAHSKPLLMPIIVQLGKSILMLEKVTQLWQQLGFQWTEVGPESILLRALPSVFKSNSNTNNTRIELLLKSILKLPTIDAVIDFIANDCAKTEIFTIEKSLEILRESTSKNFIKQLSLNELRSLLWEHFSISYL